MNGMSDNPNAAETPIVAKFSGMFTSSNDITVIVICTPFKNPSGNNGLIGLSTNLAINISAVDGLDSLFINPPGNLPDA